MEFQALYAIWSKPSWRTIRSGSDSPGSGFGHFDSQKGGRQDRRSGKHGGLGAPKDRSEPGCREVICTTSSLPGDDVRALSRRFGTTVENLERLNGISAQDLRSGSMLKVPGDAKSATEPAPESDSDEPASDTLTTVEPPGERGGFSGIEQRAASCGAVLPMTDGDKQNPNYLVLPGFLTGA